MYIMQLKKLTENRCLDLSTVMIFLFYLPELLESDYLLILRLIFLLSVPPFLDLT